MGDNNFPLSLALLIALVILGGISFVAVIVVVVINTLLTATVVVP